MAEPLLQQKSSTLSTDPPAQEAKQNPDVEMADAPSASVVQTQPTAEAAAAVADRPLNVKDALSYLDAVKTQFHDRPDVYNHFLDIMKDFKGQVIDTPGVIERVSNLFQGHPTLIGEFNTFLPTGYRIAVTEDPNNKNANSIRVSTPTGTTTQTTVYRTVPGTGAQLPPQPQNMQPALDYVQKIKARYADEPDRYKKFLEILSEKDRSGIEDEEIMSRGAELFKDAPDLMNGLRSFLGVSVPLDPGLDIKGKKHHATSAPSGSALPQKRKRKAADTEKNSMGAGKSASSKRQKNRRLDDISSRHPAHEENPYDENHFFRRVRRHLDSQDTYNEFLKLINLFTQEFIDSTRLLKECRTYLGEGELLMQLKVILGWDDRRELYAMDDHFWPASGNIQPKLRGPKSNATFGSYMRLPAHEINVACSGRDEMCKSVLNDEWISRPTFASEDSGFVAHKKNIYEEALHRSEEERHEYDFHIEAIVKTIGLLDPINNKIAQLNPEERGHFKLKPNFGGAGKSIHHRVIRKIYGRDNGEEIIRAMQDSPALSIPVVLVRLKQKEEEWKRAQREWNKVWREVDARNYYKSLDHQGITFKAIDKKAITTKAFVSQIEAGRAEQAAKRASYIDPLFGRTRSCHQLEFTVDNISVLQDSLKLIFSFLDRTSGQLSQGERKRVEGFLRTFIPMFFMLDPPSFNAAFSTFQELGDSEMSDEVASGAEDDGSSVAGSSRAGRGGRKSATNGNTRDLRKKLLKSGQAKLKNRSARSQGQASPSISRAQSPEDDSNQRVEERTPRRSTFHCNTAFYVLLRLLELFYSRLLVFKNLGLKLSKASPPKFNLIANGLGLTNEDGRFQNATHFYDFLLESCEKLFDNEIDVPLFEDQMRYMFGPKEAYKIFTVDKLIGAIIKQVQCVFSDTKSQDLYTLLKKERENMAPSVQEEAEYRKEAEKIIGDTDHLFRVDWIPELKAMTMQLLGKDDPRRDEPEMFVERWQSYIESFTTTSATQGIVTSKLKHPFLRRNLPPSVDELPSNLASGGALEMKICVRTYRIFYVARTGDFLWSSGGPVSSIPKKPKGDWYKRLQEGEPAS